MALTRRIILLSGPVSSGKSKLAKGLERLGFNIIKTRDILAKTASSGDRISLQNEGDRLDRETKGRWVLEGLSRVIREGDEKLLFVVDSVRIREQIDAIRSAFREVIHIHLTAPAEVLNRRYEERIKGQEGQPSYAEVRKNPTESKVDSLADIADVVINTNRSTEEDVLARAMGHLSHYTTVQTGYVDVIIGGQYGSEGKGQIVAYIAPEYDLLVRVGGPNAGHQVFEEPEPDVYHLLPSGTRRSSARLLLAPGMVLNVDKLLEEVSKVQVNVDRLKIDPQAMVITQEDIDKEEAVRISIGSTKQGVGQATARKITDRNPGSVKLARDIEVLRPYLKPAFEVISEAVSRGERILVEGTQGFGLSLHHGAYPFVTSRDTSVAGCLSEAGIPPTLVRRVVMVCRTFPIRVQNPEGGTSGPMSQEITWEEVSARSGIPIGELRNREKTSTTKRDRRVSEFDWYLLRRAAAINGPTDIALTFTDYLRIENRNAKRLEQLQPGTINFIEEIERVSGAKVSLIATGFNSRPIIDRRQW